MMLKHFGNLRSTSWRQPARGRSVRTNLSIALAIFTLGALAAQVARAQPKLPTPDGASGLRVPGSLSRNLKAVGDRLSSSGNERLVLAGTLTERGAVSNVELIYELPGRFRLEGPGKTLIFDGAAAWSSAGQTSAPDEDLLESLGADSVEGFFHALLEGGALRLLGRRFRIDDGSSPDYRGPWHDIFELTARSHSRRDRPEQQKLFYFDSVSGLLVKVRYLAKPNTTVETVVGQWQNLNGHWVPTEIARVVNGETVFAFRTNSANVVPRANDGLFSRP